MSDWVVRKSELQSLAAMLQVRPDWHEPDEQGLTVQMIDGDFDNAMRDRSEAHIVLRQTLEDGEQKEWRFNCADLFAMACE